MPVNNMTWELLYIKFPGKRAVHQQQNIYYAIFISSLLPRDHYYENRY